MGNSVEDVFSLRGRVAVVTGAASGIGRETAVVLAEAGADVVLCDIDAAGLDATAAQVTQVSGTATSIVLDVRDRRAMEDAADRAMAARGRVDIWVNAAGVIVDRSILEAQEDEVDRLIAINLKGVYWGCAAAGRVMRQAGSGAIVNISSGGGESAVPGLSIYSMTKAAVNMLTRTTAKEFGPLGIRANAVAPGWIDTPLGGHGFRDAAGAIDPEKRANGLRFRAQLSPLGLTGVPRDVAYTVLYLVSDAARFVTGQVLRPNGGVAMP